MLQESEVAALPGAQSKPDVSLDVQEVAAARLDPHAFVVLYERYLTRVYRYCLVRLHTQTAAEDATSEVFLKALVKLHSFRRGTFAGWLFVIARNVVTDHYRRRRPSESLDMAAEVLDGQATTESRAIAAERRRALHEALSVLTREQRDLVDLQLAGWRDSEIAAALGKSRTAVKMLRYRAVQRLRARLERAGWDPSDWTDD
jgi:RNA polymerase sigma-70 factor (ECF subfamily)